MSDLAPYEQAPSPERRPAPDPAPPADDRSTGDGPRELWRRANAATRGTVLGVLLVLLVAGSFLAGRATAPDGGGTDPATAADAPADTQLSAAELARARTDDAAAKRVARDVVTFVESCAAVAADGDYSRCRTAAQLNVGSTLPLVDGARPGRGQAAVAASREGFTVVSVSASGNSFSIGEEGTSEPVRTCTDGGAKDAGCVGGVW
ncbi:hypothetical protein [Patulibacter sp.]|uniref:hypothetical protein n=1 Tax=Patulibacter sp. TaxID=1912859 RepID=UPI00272499A9|nr:hypothetical protein [Patulibacter sp.]MDO9410464.1 hypothetical protein [Patulibacter sp.]